MTCSMDSYLGAYLLDALEPDETRSVERHLTECPICLQELDGLAETISLLALVEPSTARQLLDVHRIPEADPSGVTRRARRSATGRSIVGAPLRVAAALFAVLVIAGGSAVIDGPNPTAAAVVRAVDPSTHIRASVTMTGVREGTALQLRLAGAYPGGWCSLVASSADGARDTAATWVADPRGFADVSGTTAIAFDRIAGLEVVSASGDVLVRIELPGPDR
ncbi:anti-sigma factor family protein [Nakamurella lactea]|uniref:anti-sigma factor family protein n=1 Tax=Nakamurella lactea TaxID=459515 RepID=UPI00048B5FA5|nr:zf-HC2 domain-containing protein [Nakamurella lactea]